MSSMKPWTAPPIGPVIGQAGTATVLAQSYAAVSAPSDVTEDTLATITVPANALGANGVLRIYTLWTMTNSANNKITRIRFSGGSGTQYMAITNTTVASLAGLTIIANAGATNSQKGWPGGTTTFMGSSSVAVTTSAVDTTAATTIVITGQKALNTETLTLEGYTVELVKP